MRVFICEHCGNMMTLLQDKGVPVQCCGQKMTELIPGTSDGAHEKHIPAVTVDGAAVTAVIGEVEHPMIDAHYIQLVALETDRGIQIKYLKPGEAPKAVFVMAEGEKALAVYEYCNLHGLWKKDI